MRGLTPSENGVVALLCLGFVLGLAVKTARDRWFPINGYHADAKVVDVSEGAAPHDNVLKRFRVNVNTAGPEALASLPGIGPVLARRIIEYRNEHGPFVSIEALDLVKGIGVKTIEKLRPHISIGQ